METAATTPIRIERRVSASPTRAFEVFFHQIDSWWPLGTHSVHGERGTVIVEAGPQGRIVEHPAEGEDIEWARVEVWDPPRRLVLRWHPNPERSGDTEVEVRFTPDGDGTMVELEHRGWEHIGPEGSEIRGEYDTGWIPVLDRFRELVGG
ncbi:MAG: SRPBCC domain-containing protein [Actinomycetota bacterium]|nr:SRPBCC domain-containing protein [Actinomycetota bacterium]